MSAGTVRLYKEARALWWPWILITAAGLLATATAAQAHTSQVNLLSRLWREFAVPVGSFLGIPLIATMAFSLDFQHRTMPLLLSQPIDRMQLWSEKMRVMIAAVIPPAIIYCIAWSFYAPQYDKNNPFGTAGTPWVVAAICLFVVTAAAPFWTLVARTTMGSLVLNGMFPWSVLFCFVFLSEHVPASSGLWPVIRVIAAVVIVAYASAMVWLSRRRLARFQVTGSTGGDLLIDSPLPVPQFFEESFRCRPTGAVMNLVRKELRLLRPVWALALFSMAVWLTVAAFGALPARDAHSPTPMTNAQTIMIALAGVLSVVIAILSATVPLGEERASGAHAWHMTMPVAARTQWLVKFLVAFGVSVVGGALIPLATLFGAGLAAGSPYRYVGPEMWLAWPGGLAILTLFAFWSACAVSGTVRATLWMFPIGWAFGLAAVFGDWICSQTGMPVANWALSRMDPFLFEHWQRSVIQRLDRMGAGFPPNPLVLGIPVFLFLLVQSYFLFRGQPSASKWQVPRALILPLALAAVCAMSAMMPWYLEVAGYRHMRQILTETHNGIQARNAQVGTDHRLQVSGEELAGDGSSDETRHWLHGARVTVTALENPYMYHPGDVWVSVKAGPDDTHPAYSAAIDLASGRHCVLRYQRYPVHPNPALAFSWPDKGSLTTTCN